MTKHVHVSTESRDCDGRYSSGHVGHRYNEYGNADSRSRLATFAEELALMIPDGTEVDVRVKVEWPNGWENDPILSASYGTDTEEGFSATAIQECNDDCDLEGREQRDHSAERAGY